MAKSNNTTISSVETVFKAIDDKLNDIGGGCSGALDRVEQMSWLLFLRYLDAQEENRRLNAELEGKQYEPALPKKLSWRKWAYPVDKQGKFDIDQAMNGDELLAFAKNVLFPGLRELRDTSQSTSSIQYRIGSIFHELTCRFTNGYTLRDVIDLIEPLQFQSDEDRHEMTSLYEGRLNDMGNAGKNGGQYYTPRPLIRTMVRILDPKLGEKFYDGACGSGGFLCEAFSYMKKTAPKRADTWSTLQEKTFYGGEAKSLAYVTAQMNCILHGLETPNIRFGDTLELNPTNITAEDKVDVIGANPPFGASVTDNVRRNFVSNSSASEYLFMEHFVAMLKDGGRAAIIIKNTALSNTDNASKYIRQMLLERCELEMILDLPQRVFKAGVKAVVLFFKKGKPTTKPIKYYELDLHGVSLGKTRPLKEEDLAEFEAIAKGEKSGEGIEAYWEIDPASVDKTTFDLSVKNPNKKEEKKASSAECKAAIVEAYNAIGEILKDWK